jgi:hypothetical protein
MFHHFCAEYVYARKINAAELEEIKILGVGKKPVTIDFYRDFFIFFE